MMGRSSITIKNLNERVGKLEKNVAHLIAAFQIQVEINDDLSKGEEE